MSAFTTCLWIFAAAAGTALAQAPVQVQVTSPEVTSDRSIIFRLRAPQAQAVRVSGSDIPGNDKGTAMAKGENGIWQATLGPLEPGAYRYNLNVDGLPVVDPRNPHVSESNDNVWSLAVVPGSDLIDTKNVPHGAVSIVTYHSSALGRFRRMHVYTPPGYEQGQGRYPVFYLLHGASDSDQSWTSAGRAPLILDNLIAAKKARPMIVVMPAGHTTSGGFRTPASSDEFTRDFVSDVMPYVERNYRTKTDRASRAIAGLSMGGGQTLNIAIPHLDRFAYIGVFSSGIFSMFPSRSQPVAPGPTWEDQHRKMLDNADLKKGLKLVWFKTGKDDFLLNSTRSSVELLKKHAFDVKYEESTGGHTWLNWRAYLIEFVPQLFEK